MIYNLDELGYLNSLREVMYNGTDSSDRTGTGTIRYPGITNRYNISFDHFPLFTTKFVPFNCIMIELLWFLRGDIEIKWLQDRKARIWDEWVLPDGTMGPGYGQQWRAFGSDNGPVDQIKNIIKQLKETPDSRRIIVSAWNPGRLSEMALPPCHSFFQFTVIGDTLNCHLTQRSGDMFLGVPFNVASYALLMLLLCKECNLKPGQLVHTINDAHVYSNHIEQVKTQLSRETYRLPEIVISDEIFKDGLLNFIDNCKEYPLEKFKELIYIKDYRYHPKIEAPVAV